jgi:tetratricopeptide (TPR) repeat protein/TolB-like protein
LRSTVCHFPSRYNETVVRTLRLFVYCSALLAGTACAFAQSPTHATDTIIVIPFANTSGAPGLQWISEAFPAFLSKRLASPNIFPLTREDRMRAYDRAGIPPEVQPSRATVYRLVEAMDVDYVVLGRYTFDGRTFTATAQPLEMQHRRLLPEVAESGTLTDLINIQTALAWDLLHAIAPDAHVDRQSFLDATPTVRLDAFENYIRGTTAGTNAERITHFREAVRLSSSYTEAWLRLGRAYFDEKQYDETVSALSHVPPTDAGAGEANFYLGLAAYKLQDFSRAETALQFVALRLPLPEVYSNLGAATSHLGKKKEAIEYFQKAAQADSHDADYRFNLAVALWQTGARNEAAEQLKECLALSATDTEARAFLDSLPNNSPSSQSPAERLKTNYDENTFRQLFLGIQAAAEERLAKTDAVTHAVFHVGRGRELLAQGFVAEAQKQFEEAVSLDSSNAEAHAGMAHALEAANDFGSARAEAEKALSIRMFVDPLLLLARLDLRDNKNDAAASGIERALKLEPANASAHALKRTLAAKLAQKTPPGTN